MWGARIRISRALGSSSESCKNIDFFTRTSMCVFRFVSHYSSCSIDHLCGGSIDLFETNSEIVTSNFLTARSFLYDKTCFDIDTS